MTVLALPKYIYYSAYNPSTSQFVANDQAQHTIILRRDGASKAPDNASVNVGDGLYEIELTDAERVAEVLAIAGSTTTPDVVLQPIFNAADTRLQGMSEPSAQTPTLARLTQDAQTVVYTHITDSNAAIIVHGDGAGGWGSIADVSNLALETTVVDGINSVLSAGGAGPWSTAVGFSTPQDVTDARDAVITHGQDGPWTTGGGGGGTVDANVIQWNGATEPVAEWAKQTTSIKSGVLVDAATTPTASEFSTSLTEAMEDHWKNRSVIMITGAIKLQASLITGYTLSGGKGIITVAGFTTAPQVGDELLIV